MTSEGMRYRLVLENSAVLLKNTVASQKEETTRGFKSGELHMCLFCCAAVFDMHRIKPMADGDTKKY